MTFIVTKRDMINYLNSLTCPIFHRFLQTARDHRMLCRVADTITTFDEIATLGLELNCNPNDVSRLRSENRSIKGAAYEILRSFYSRKSRSNKSMEAKLREALRELGKEALALNLGLVDSNSDVT